MNRNTYFVRLKVTQLSVNRKVGDESNESSLKGYTFNTYKNSLQPVRFRGKTEHFTGKAPGGNTNIRARRRRPLPVYVEPIRQTLQ